MKVEPIEYLVTFEDGDWANITYSHEENCWWLIAFNEDLVQQATQFESMEDALETLKKRKEKQDEAI